MRCIVPHLYLLISCGWAVSACAPPPNLLKNSGPPPIIATLELGDGSKRNIEPNYERGAYPLSGAFALRLRTTAEYDANAVVVQASLGPYGRGGYEDRKVDGSIRSGETEYLIESKNIKPKTFNNNQVLEVTLKPPGSDIEYNYFFLMKEEWTFSGVSSPVLLRVRGDAALFKLDNLAPSIAAGVRRNFSNDTFPFIAFNPILTIWSAEDSDGTNGYSLALGGEFDFSGYVQVGASYQFKDKKTYLILGLRPELLYNLTSGAFGAH